MKLCMKRHLEGLTYAAYVLRSLDSGLSSIGTRQIVDVKVNERKIKRNKLKISLNIVFTWGTATNFG